MNFEQVAIVVILLAMLVAYASERIRIEIVAMSGLALAFAIGLIAPNQLFSGFSSPAVITVVEVLLFAGALTQTRVMDGIARRIIATGAREQYVIYILCAIGGGISVFMNNIGALAIVFPVATSVCARMGISPAKIMMPLSFATLLGGMCSLTGTPANLVVSDWYTRETGAVIGYFELGTLGFPLLLGGIMLMSVLAPYVFRDKESESNPRGEGGMVDFIVERVVPAGSPLVGVRLPQWRERDGVSVHSVVRDGRHVFARRNDIVLAAGDRVLVEGPYARVLQLEDEGRIEREPSQGNEGDATIEFIVMPESMLVGSRVEDIARYAASTVEVLALASRRGRVEGRFSDLQLSTGDVVMLSGDRDDLRRLAAECGLLALTPRRRLRPNRRAWLGILLFACGVTVTAFDILPSEIAFGAVVLAMMAAGQLNLRDALQDLNWTIVILLACMIPLGAAVEETGAARVIANSIAGWLPTGEPLTVTMAVLLLAVAITPFIDNVSTAAVLSPIAAGLATRTGTPVEPLLMAVAVGASIDFLTPFGHHNNAVVMGAGGYRFRDFFKLGLPLTALCLVTAWLMLSGLLQG